MARLYSNENFPLPVVEELRKLGHDVRTIQESGKSNQVLLFVPQILILSGKPNGLMKLFKQTFH